jgi:hypothetical protein
MNLSFSLLVLFLIENYAYVGEKFGIQYRLQFLMVKFMSSIERVHDFIYLSGK